MAFIHKRKGHVEHKHETVAEARLCEQNRETVTTVYERPKEGGMVTIREAKHQTPCVCGPYDRCWEFRVAGARSQRDLHRAYND